MKNNPVPMILVRYPELFSLIEEMRFSKAEKIIQQMPDGLAKLIYRGNLYRMQGDVDSCDVCIEDAERMITAETDNLLILELKLLEARNFWQKREIDNCLRALAGLLPLLILQPKSTDIDEIRGYALSLEGACYHYKGEYDRAKEKYHEAIAVREKLGKDPELALTLVNLAALSQEIGDYESAMELNIKALKINEGVGNKVQIATILNNIGNLYRMRGYLKEALEYLEMSDRIAVELGSDELVHFALFNKGYVYQSFGEYELALDCYESCESYFEKMDYPDDLANLLCNKGLLLWRSGHVHEAHEVIRRSRDIRRSLGNHFDETESLLLLVRTAAPAPDGEPTYIEQLREVVDKFSDEPLLDLRLQVAEGLVLKQNPRLRKKLQAIDIFQSIADGEIIDYELSILAMSNLCELLFLEFKSSEDMELLDDIKGYLEKLNALATQQNLLAIQIEVSIFMGRMYLVELQIHEAEQVLDQAYNLAKEKGMRKLLEAVNEERKKLAEQITKWNEASMASVSYLERVKAQKLDEYLDMVFR